MTPFPGRLHSGSLTSPDDFLGTNVVTLEKVDGGIRITALGEGDGDFTVWTDDGQGQIDGLRHDLDIHVRKVPATLTLTPATLDDLAIGESATVTAALFDANGHDIQIADTGQGGMIVRWESSDPLVARVGGSDADSTLLEESGASATITSVSAGTATITASWLEVTGTITSTTPARRLTRQVSITTRAPETVAPAIVSAEIVPSDQTFTAIGEWVNIEAFTYDADGNPKEPDSWRWTSSDPLVATVQRSNAIETPNGRRALLRALKEGTATITYTAASHIPGTTQMAESVTATATATVTVAPEGARIVFTPDHLVFDSLGETKTVTFQTFDEDGNQIPNPSQLWVTSQSTIDWDDMTGAFGWTWDGGDSIEVDSVGVGNGEIKVSTGTIQDYVPITEISGILPVRVQQVPASLVVEPDTIDLEVGDTQTLTATLTDANGNEVPQWGDGGRGGPVVQWSSSDESVLTVAASENPIPGNDLPAGPTATVTGVASGTATITAFWQNLSDTATMTEVGTGAKPTGLPTISGAARVGETLTASAAGIADDDGLANATFSWQWISNDGTADADIAGATAATYTLTSDEAGKTITVRATFTDDGGTVETLVSAATAVVEGVNSDPTGLPTISGTARAGQVLTASASGIADEDGLTGATYSWQWIVNDGTADADIAGATAETYMLTQVETGKTIKVRATFTDDRGTEEVLISEATAAVEAGLTARFENVPTSHDGPSASWFRLRLAFSDDVFDGSESFDKNRAIRHALVVSGGAVRGTRRVNKDEYDQWWVKIAQAGNGTVTVSLPAQTNCEAAGALCTPDGTALLSPVQAVIPGPASLTREVSIAPTNDTQTRRGTANSSPVTEGTAAEFTLTRTGSLADALTVSVSVTETGAMLNGTVPATVTFNANSSTADLRVETEDDEVAEPASAITAALAAGSGYSMDADAASASVTIEDDDAAPVVQTAAIVPAPENTTAVATLSATDDDTPVADLAWSIAGGADAAMFTVSAGGDLAFASAKDFEAPDDADTDGDYEVTVRVTDGANADDAVLTVRLVDADDISPALTDASVDGDALTLTFGEPLDGGSVPAPSAFSATVNGAARGISGVSASGSSVTLTLASAVVSGETVTVAYAVPTGANARPLRDAAENAVAGFSNRAVTNATPVSNAAPTGLPAISGTPQVGETLTASSAGIADADGLTHATYAWQWIVNDGTSDADIAGATGATYTLTAAEAGKTVKVRVTFTDDEGTQETLVSEATAAVTVALPSVSVAAVSSPVTEGTAASFTLSRTGATAAALTVAVSVTEEGTVLSGTPASSVTFAAGSAEATLSVATVDDSVAEADARVTVAVAAGSGYQVGSGADSAWVDVYDNDEVASAPVKTLWASTLEWQGDYGAGWVNANEEDFSSPGWSEDGRECRIWYLAYGAASRELWLRVNSDLCQNGITEPETLALHVGGVTVGPGDGLSNFAQRNIGIVTGVEADWTRGEQVQLRLTRTEAGETAVSGPGISVEDAQVREAEGAALAFRVSLDDASASVVSVRYATSDGTANAGADYVAQSGVLRFAPGEVRKTVSVPVLNDAHDEGSETLTLALSRPFGAELADADATGTIVNTDPIPKAWITRFGRTVGSQVVDAVTARFEDRGRSHVTVGGMTLGNSGPYQAEWSDWNDWETERRSGVREMTERELLLGSSFHLSSGEHADGGPAFAAWGRVASDRFEGDVDDVEVEGDVTTGLLGFDAEWERVLAGVLLSQSRGDGSYALGADVGSDRGTVESTLTAVYPYARVEMSERVSAWGLAGVGQGELTLHQEGEARIDTDLAMRMGAVGVKGTVLDGSDGSGVGLNVKSDAMWVRTESDSAEGLESAAGDVTRLRLILEGERVFVAGCCFSRYSVTDFPVYS